MLREGSKEIHTLEYTVPFVPSHTYETYNVTYGAVAWISLVISIMALVVYVLELIFVKVDTVKACGSTITLYRGSFAIILYVDGKEVSRSRYFLEAPLANGTTVTVSLSGNFLYAHMSFSNGDSPIDL